MSSTSVMMQNVQNSVSHLCADAAKAFLRSSHPSSGAANDDADVCAFLASHFEAAAAQKKRENRLCLSREDVMELISWIIREKLGDSNTVRLFSDSEESAFQDAAAAILAAPRISQRDVTAFFESRNINTAALPEVFEVARALQHLVVSKTTATNSGGNTVAAPFGTVNCIQLAAICCTLTLVRSHFEVLELALECCASAAANKNSNKSKSPPSTLYVQMFCACWAFIDTSNAAMWNAAARLMSRFPGVTVPLLLDMVPSIETMGASNSTFIDDVNEKLSASSSSAAAASGASPQRAGVVVVHDPENEQQQAGGSDDDDDAEEEEEVDEEATRARQDFWAGLTAAAAPRE